jgi:hypothetical protein
MTINVAVIFYTPFYFGNEEDFIFTHFFFFVKCWKVMQKLTEQNHRERIANMIRMNNLENFSFQRKLLNN